ncbi:MAG: BamA/TamA family outer membrane protein [Bacteroidales bacterium]|nr:BamA/TamA family outer membrane protein [Bacteroidales bacterium]
MRRRIPYILVFIIPILLFSCRATKYVPEDQYLLHSYKIESGNGDFEKKALNDYIKQKPNKRIFFWRFYLSLYNLSSPKKDNGFNRWLKRIGEPPVVYDEDLKEKSAEQLILYMRNKGFYQVEVSDTTQYRKKRATVMYTVTPNQPYRIRDISYFFHDASLSSLVMADTTSSGFRQGELFDVDLLQQERIRIETVLRNSGYYSFNRDFVYFEVDSSLNSHQVDITLGIRNFPDQDRSGKVVHVDHPVYKIRDVYLISDYDAVSSQRMRDSGLVRKDTLLFDSIHVVYSEKPNIRPSVVTQKNYIIPNKLFNASNVQRTYRNLSSLSALRMVDIRFNEVESDSNLLDCEVMIAAATRQSYTIKLEGTNSGGNIGAAGNLNYRHQNLFGGSEQFDLSFLGAIETLRETSSDTVSSLNLMQEFGVEARLRIPKFLLPFKTDQFIRRYNPQTNIRLSYNYQKRPQYTRTLANASFGYEWKGNKNLTHRVYPLEASLILTPFMRDDFRDWLEGMYLFYSYQPHLIIDSRYTMIFTNQKLLKNQDFQDVRVSLETAGNLLYGGYKLLAPDPGDDKYQLFGVDFAQYLKGDIDLRNYNFLYEDVSLVLRGFAGVGYAFLNSNAMPFEKQYFSGGANSIRAWQVKNLGPGSYNDTTVTSYPNQTGDVKLEANMEYRFKLFWKLEAAFFLDVGNIWSLSDEDDREGAGFEFKRFYKELAVGTGVGTRFVFSFFIFRFDLGIPLRNPYPIEGYNWLPGNAGVKGSDLTFNIAIGYPF